jgi:hypothetical protein
MDSTFADRKLFGLSTGPGLVRALMKNPPQDHKVKFEGEDEEPSIDDTPIFPSVLVTTPEFEELLAVMKRKDDTIASILKQLWDGQTVAVTTKVDPMRVKGVTPSALSHVTATALKTSLTHTDQANGFANRFMMVCFKRVRLLPRGDSSHLDYTHVIRELKAAVAAAKNCGLVKRDEDAEELWAEEYKKLSMRGQTMTEVILARGDAHIVRLSLLYALLDKSREIRSEHLRAAIAFWDYCEDSVVYLFGEAVDPSDDRILRKLAGGPLTTDEIRRHVFGGNKTAAWVEARLKALAEKKKVRAGTKDMKTKKNLAAWHLA